MRPYRYPDVISLRARDVTVVGCRDPPQGPTMARRVLIAHATRLARESLLLILQFTSPIRDIQVGLCESEQVVIHQMTTARVSDRLRGHTSRGQHLANTCSSMGTRDIWPRSMPRSVKCRS